MLTNVANGGETKKQNSQTKSKVGNKEAKAKSSVDSRQNPI